MTEYLYVLGNYATFNGRATRRQYWLFFLMNMLFFIGLTLFDNLIGIVHHAGSVGLLGGAYVLAMLIPTAAVTVRRLHDTNRTGWWALSFLVPIIGLLIWLFMMVEQGTPGENRYGPNPL